MPHKIYKHKLLLDENFPQRSKLVRLNSRFDLKHIVKDYKKQGAKDEEIFNLAILINSGPNELYGKFTYIAGEKPTN